MADIKVEDLMQSIRQRARESAPQHAEPLFSMQDSAGKPFARLQTSLTITSRTHDQLPPLTTHRSGVLARAELWIKRRLKRATHWFTWGQVNFNSATHSALNHTLTILQAYDQRLASVQDELDAAVASKSNLEARLIELAAALALTESRFEQLLTERTAELRTEYQKRLELLLNEQRVCFKQLELEIREAGGRSKLPTAC
jgi:hypothetical protein